MTARRVVVLGSGAGRRFEAFREAAHRVGVTDVIACAYGQAPDVAPGDWLRFDSPDESAAAVRAVLDAGRDMARGRGFGDFDGAMGASAQLAFGLHALQQSALRPDVRVTATPDEIALCYDKTACAAHLQARGIAVPQVLAPPDSFDALLALLAREKRVFVKQRFGAGAAGTMALMAGPKGQMVCYTTLDLVDGAVRFVKRVQKVTSAKVISQMFAFLQPMGVHVDRWVPKAGLDGRTCDMRVVAIRGAPPFAVLRRSRGPITNLHLDAERGGAEGLFAQMDPSAVDALWATVAKVQDAFPNCITVAPDIAVTADLRSHVVLEVNAFGDHIRRMTIDGLTPQDWQMRHMMEERPDAA